MKTNTIKTLAILLLGTVVFSCTTNQKTEEADNTSTEEAKPSITLTKAPASPAYEDASLNMLEKVSKLEDSVYSISYDFEVANFELGMQTEGADTRGIANSGKGQHIHFIINNGPYSAHYDPKVERELPEGNNVVLAFLSRSYHESVKNPNAFFVSNVKVGDIGAEEADLTAPHLFYSRPKGTYKGDDTKKVMLDFYLVNTSISADGNKIRATINGTEFMIDEWTPYYIEGLEMGEVSIKLELLDAEGNAVPGPFNSVERTVTLEE